MYRNKKTCTYKFRCTSSCTDYLILVLHLVAFTQEVEQKDSGLSFKQFKTNRNRYFYCKIRNYIDFLTSEKCLWVAVNIAHHLIVTVLIEK